MRLAHELSALIDFDLEAHKVRFAGRLRDVDIVLDALKVVIEFDVDSAKALESRQRLLAEAARDKLWVAGAHLSFPGLGHVRKDTQGYAWVPAEFSPIRSDR